MEHITRKEPITPKISYTEESAKEIVKRFCDQVHGLKDARHFFTELFENEQLPALMDSTASSVFNLFGNILHRYLLLEFAKITDPSETRGNENLTVNYLTEKICWPLHCQCILIKLSAEANCFIKRYIQNVRNKQLAHTDVEALLANKPLGASFPEGEDEKFLKTLQEVCNITHEACFGRIYGEMFPPVVGDVVNLKRTLEHAIAFKEFLSEGSREEQTKLNSYWERVSHRFTETQRKALKHNS
jgi:hypothetical protein